MNNDEPVLGEIAGTIGSNTEKKLPSGKPFKKGYDPRRNLRGVPKEAIKARHLLRKIAAELLTLPNGGGEITRIEAMLTAMFSSKAPADRQNLLKALWPGLLKDELDLTSGGERVTFIVERDERDTPEALPPTT